MASSSDFAEYVCERLSGSGEIVSKKMFGEYGLYCDGKFFALICDNQLFIKITPAGEALLPDCPQAPPYEGARPYFLLEDLDDADFLCNVARVTCAELPPPKPRKKSTNK